jgi:hypothetical protein
MVPRWDRFFCKLRFNRPIDSAAEFSSRERLGRFSVQFGKPGQ